MKQWSGLLKKEWVLMSGQFYATVGMAILFTLIMPFGSTLFNWGLNFLEVSLILSITWLAASLLIPTIILLVSLGKEMHRPDVWLHSRVSIFKLFGSKALFAGFVGAINIAVPAIVILIESGFSAFPLELTNKVIYQFGSLLFIAVYITSLLIMCTGLFFGVLYQLMKPVVKGFTVPIVLILFLVSSWVVERITTTAVYEKFSGFGAITGPGEGRIDTGIGNSYFYMDAVVFYASDILMDLLLAVLLFITATILFERKVRL